MYGIYANIGGILMVNVAINSSTMDPSWDIKPPDTRRKGLGIYAELKKSPMNQGAFRSHGGTLKSSSIYRWEFVSLINKPNSYGKYPHDLGNLLKQSQWLLPTSGLSR